MDQQAEVRFACVRCVVGRPATSHEDVVDDYEQRALSASHFVGIYDLCEFVGCFG